MSGFKTRLEEGDCECESTGDRRGYVHIAENEGHGCDLLSGFKTRLEEGDCECESTGDRRGYVHIAEND